MNDMNDINASQFSFLRNKVGGYIATLRAAIEELQDLEEELFPSTSDLDTLHLLNETVARNQTELAGWAHRINERSLTLAHSLGRSDP